MTRQYYNSTQGLCNECGELGPAKIYFENGKVYMEKFCHEHKLTQALIFSDEEKYKELSRYATSGKTPLSHNSQIAKGCPDDCGLCPNHSQHTCLPIVEITDRCNLKCHICIAENDARWEMDISEFKSILDNLMRCEGKLDIFNISGGEPTLHPNIKEMIDLALKYEIAVVTINTNGLKLIQDESLLEFLASRKVVVALQFDGFSDNTYNILRGRPLLKEKLKILEKLEEYGIQTSLIVTAVKDLNDKELSDITKYFLSKPFICSMTVQPLSVHRDLPKAIKFDPMDRLTTPDVIKYLCEGSNSAMNKNEILPLPCSHPACFHVVYLIDLGEGEYVPINKFFPAEEYLNMTRDRGVFGLDSESVDSMNRIVYDLWSSSGTVPTIDKILNAARNLLREVSKDYSPQKAMRLGSSKIKSIFIHHFMDKYNFDISRANKCCEHYPKADGKLWPCCVYNIIKRER